MEKDRKKDWEGGRVGKGKWEERAEEGEGERERTERDNEKILRKLGFSLRSGEPKVKLCDDAGCSKLMLLARPFDSEFPP